MSSFASAISLAGRCAVLALVGERLQMALRRFDDAQSELKRDGDGTAHDPERVGEALAEEARKVGTRSARRGRLWCGGCCLSCRMTTASG